MAHIAIVIPTYNPTHLLLNTIADLNSFPEIEKLSKVVILDGPISNTEVIEEIKNVKNLTLLNHSKNKGKGAAIKTALQYIVEKKNNYDYVITVDSDGQHRGKDVLSLIDSITTNGEGVHIGSRGLAIEKTPIRSLFGNILSRKIFGLIYRYKLQDTQSGLRAYPKSSFTTLLSFQSNRYEFEMEAIINLIHRNFKIFEIPIETVYFNKNRSSHFRPLKDSTLVIWVMVTNRIKNKFKR